MNSMKKFDIILKESENQYSKGFKKFSELKKNLI